jgi:hypothetical protein
MVDRRDQTMTVGCVGAATAPRPTQAPSGLSGANDRGGQTGLSWLPLATWNNVLWANNSAWPAAGPQTLNA